MSFRIFAVLHLLPIIFTFFNQILVLIFLVLFKKKRNKTKKQINSILSKIRSMRGMLFL